MAFSAAAPSSIVAPLALPVDPAVAPAWALPVSCLAAAAGRCIPPVRRPAVQADPAVVPAWVRVPDLALARALASVPAWAVPDSQLRLQARRPAPSVPALPEAAVASNIPR